MIYSVWDHAERRYTYYQSAEKSSATSAPKPTHLQSKTLGCTPEEAAWPLPSGVVKVGTGKYPKGFISTEKKGVAAALGFFDITDIIASPTKLLVVGAAGYFAWKYFIEEKINGL